MFSVQESTQGGYVLQSDRSSSFGLFSSLKFIWATAGTKSIYGVYVRPPFPIKVDQPTMGDILREMRGSDLFMGATMYGTGILWSYYISRNWPMLGQRLVLYHGFSHIAFICAASSMWLIPYRRLTGFWDNGLRWKVPEDRLRKFDNTSVFEANTIFKHFRVRSDQ